VPVFAETRRIVSGLTNALNQLNALARVLNVPPLIGNELKDQHSEEVKVWH
jgi:hypothetical protein